MHARHTYVHIYTHTHTHTHSHMHTTWRRSTNKQVHHHTSSRHTHTHTRRQAHVSAFIYINACKARTVTQSHTNLQAHVRGRHTYIQVHPYNEITHTCTYARSHRLTSCRYTNKLSRLKIHRHHITHIHMQTGSHMCNHTHTHDLQAYTRRHTHTSAYSTHRTLHQTHTH